VIHGQARHEHDLALGGRVLVLVAARHGRLSADYDGARSGSPLGGAGRGRVARAVPVSAGRGESARVVGESVRLVREPARIVREPARVAGGSARVVVWGAVVLVPGVRGGAGGVVGAFVAGQVR
jgi:hypothetical protein